MIKKLCFTQEVKKMSVISYGKKFGIPLMLILPLIIILLLVLGGFDPETFFTQLAVPVWLFLFINSVTVSMSGYSLSSNFSKEIKRLETKGFPISSVEGFSNMYGRIRSIFSSSFLISIVVFISLITFSSIILFGQLIDNIAQLPTLQGILGPNTKSIKETLRFLVIVIALSLILIAIGISLLVNLPDAPALVPGSLMKYYNPVSMPSQIDNFLSDTVFPFLDPITRTRWDEWGQFILDNLNSEFEPEEDPQTKLEIAREKILLFAYLNLSMSEKINEELTKKELAEMFTTPDIVDQLFAGESSDITWKILLEILAKIQKKAPEIFDVVDRIIVELTDNLKSFKNNELFITTTAPSKVMGNMRPFRILVFMLNKDSTNFGTKKRPVQVKLVSEGSTTIPDVYEIHLDEAEGMEVNSESLPLIGEGEDIVGLLSRILQVGDAVWFQVFRRNFGIHLFNVRVAEEGRGSIYGKSLEITINRDFKFYLQQYGGKLSAVGGAALPIIGIAGRSLL
jgi:hypothetical protein